MMRRYHADSIFPAWRIASSFPAVIVTWYHSTVRDDFQQRDMEMMIHAAPSQSLEDDVEETIERMTQRIIARAQAAYFDALNKMETELMNRVEILMEEYGVAPEQAGDMARCWSEHFMLKEQAKLNVQKMIAENQRRTLTVAFYNWRVPQYDGEKPLYEDRVRTDQAVDCTA